MPFLFFFFYFEFISDCCYFFMYFIIINVELFLTNKSRYYFKLKSTTTEGSTEWIFTPRTRQTKTRLSIQEWKLFRYVSERYSYFDFVFSASASCSLCSRERERWYISLWLWVCVLFLFHCYLLKVVVY